MNFFVSFPLIFLLFSISNAELLINELSVVCGTEDVEISPKNPLNKWRINVAGDPHAFTDEAPCGADHIVKVPLNKCRIRSEKKNFATFYQISVLVSKQENFSGLATTNDPILTFYCVYPNRQWLNEERLKNRFSISRGNLNCEYRLERIKSVEKSYQETDYPIAMRGDQLKHFWNCSEGTIIRLKNCQIENIRQSKIVPAVNHGCPVGNKFPAVKEQNFFGENQVEVITPAFRWVNNPLTTVRCQIDVCINDKPEICKNARNEALEKQKKFCDSPNARENLERLPIRVQSVAVRSSIFVLDDGNLPMFFEKS